MRRTRIVFALAWQGVWLRPSESMLMALAFAGIFCASLTTLSMVRSGREELERNLQRFGRDIIHVSPAIKLRNLFGLLRSPLVLEDIELCARAAEGRGTPVRVALAEVAAGGEQTTTVMVATDASWTDVNGTAFASGRFFRSGAEDECVLDSWLARKLFGGADAAGGSVTLRWAEKEKTLRVAGVIEDPLSLRERFQGLDIFSSSRPLLLRTLEGRNIYVPLSFLGEGTSIRMALIRHGPGLDPREAAARIQEALGERKGDLSVWARATWIDMILDAADVAFLFSNAVWGMGLALAGAMVMTISLLTVSGRTVELGVRRTQGATRRGICGQILAEGLIMGGAGAALGLAATPVVGSWLSRELPWDMTLSCRDIAVVAGAGLAVVLGSFLLPAMRAAQLEPVEVLREL